MQSVEIEHILFSHTSYSLPKYNIFSIFAGNDVDVKSKSRVSMAFPLNILEEELKNKVSECYFPQYDTTQILSKIDFCVATKEKNNNEDFVSFLWAEAKKGNKEDICASLIQLILTIGKAKTFQSYLPPYFLGAFDAERIAFIPYIEIRDIFFQNDFNWNVTPSNHESKEFKFLYEKIKKLLIQNSLYFYFDNDEKELKKFIQENFKIGREGTAKIPVDKNNFTFVYYKWVEKIKPTIAIDWEEAKNELLILDSDFFLADLLSQENEILLENLFVVLKHKHYELNRKKKFGIFSSDTVEFKNNDPSAHSQFWNRYERPPKQEYWNYIIDRRDLLIPQDVRERKGSFFTPQQWVELSQKYIADVLGEKW